MKNYFPQEDFEREPQKDSIYLQEEEHELWLWYHEQMKREQGQIIIEYYDNTEIPEFIREGMGP